MKYAAIISDELDSTDELIQCLEKGGSDDITIYHFEAPNDELATLIGHGLFFDNDWSNDGTVNVVLRIDEA